MEPKRAMSEFFETIDLGWSPADSRQLSVRMMDASAGSVDFDSRGRIGIYIDDNPATMSDIDFPSEWTSEQLLDAFADEDDMDVATHGELRAADSSLSIAAFDLVFSVWPKQNPTWWNTVVNMRDWRGRIVIIGEWAFGGTGGTSISTWIAGVATTTIIGMKMWGTAQGPACPSFAFRAAGASDRFAAIPQLLISKANWINALVESARPIYAFTGSHAGGPTRTLPVMSETVLRDINWILSGDSNAFGDDAEFGCTGLAEINAPVFRRFATVPIEA